MDFSGEFGSPSASSRPMAARSHGLSRLNANAKPFVPGGSTAAGAPAWAVSSHLPQGVPPTPTPAQRSSGSGSGRRAGAGTREGERASAPHTMVDEAVNASRHAVVVRPAAPAPHRTEYREQGSHLPHIGDYESPSREDGERREDDLSFDDMFSSSPVNPNGMPEADTHVNGTRNNRAASTFSDTGFSQNRLCASLEKGESIQWQLDAQEGESGAPPQTPSRRRQGVQLEDFELLHVIGMGGFSKVIQVRHVPTGEIHAMKVLKKQNVETEEDLDYLMREREILETVSCNPHPFIIPLHYAFQTQHTLYLVMSFLNGGQLFFHLKREHMFPEEAVRFYLAEVILALAHLHKLNIVHRDLKPENLILDAEGHVSLTDFGLAVSVQNTKYARSLVGTDEYLAPEMIKGEPYDTSVDWWSLGVLAYDLLCGEPPFRHNNRNKLKEKIVTGKYFTPQYLSRDARSLIRGLLQNDPAKRLGSGEGGAEEIKKHPFFRQVRWDAVEQRALDPPFCPHVADGDIDVSQFDSKYTDMTPLITPPTSSFQLRESFERAFEGFTYEGPGFKEKE